MNNVPLQENSDNPLTDPNEPAGPLPTPEIPDPYPVTDPVPELRPDPETIPGPGPEPIPGPPEPIPDTPPNVIF